MAEDNPFLKSLKAQVKGAKVSTPIGEVDPFDDLVKKKVSTKGSASGSAISGTPLSPSQSDEGFRKVTVTAPTKRVAPQTIEIEDTRSKRGAGAVAQEAVRSVGRGFTEAVPSTLESAAVLGKKLDTILPESLQSYQGQATEDLATWRAARKLRENISELFPKNKDLQNNLIVQSAEGLGQVGAMLLARSPVGAGTLGVTQMGSSEYRQALDYYKDVKALDEEEFVKKYTKEPGEETEVKQNYKKLKNKDINPDEQAFENWLYGAAIGSTEALPILKYLKRADQVTRGAIKQTIFKKAIKAGVQGVEEALQEGLSQGLSNLQARETYDTTRDLLENVKESAEVGGLVGATLQTLLGINRRKMGTTTSAEEKAILRANEAQINRFASELDQSVNESTEQKVEIENNIVKLQEDLKNPSIPDEVKADIEKKIDSLDKKLEGKEKPKMDDKFDDDLSAGIDEDIKQLSAALEDPNISEDTKEVIRTRIEEKHALRPKQKGEDNAIQIESTDEISVQPTPGDSGEVGEGIPQSGLPEATQETITKEVQVSEPQEEITQPETNEQITETETNQDNGLESVGASVETEGTTDYAPKEGVKTIKLSVNEDLANNNVGLRAVQLPDGKFGIFQEDNGKVVGKSLGRSFDTIEDLTSAYESGIKNKLTAKAIKDANDTPYVIGDSVSFTDKVGEEGSGVVESRETDGSIWVRKSNGIVEKIKSSQIQNSSVEQAQDRKSNLSSQRIQYARRSSKISPKKLNQIIGDISEKLKATVIYSKSRRRGALGTYNPTNALVNIRNAGDIDTVAHEIGHLIDDRYDLLGNVPSNIRDDVDKEIKWFFDRGGSNPPAGLNAVQKGNYLQREGLGEFIRAYVANPGQAKLNAPTLYEYFESTVDADVIQALKEFSNDFIDFANATAGEQIISNIQDSDLKDKEGFKAWIQSLFKKRSGWEILPGDNLKSQLTNSLHIAELAYDYANKLGGKSKIIPEQNFEVLARVFAGVNGKVDRIFKSGLTNAKNEYLTDKGENLNIEWLLAPLDSTSEATIKRDREDVIKLLVAERTIEYAKKFSRNDKLTGVGGGIRSDSDVALEYMEQFESLKESNPDKYNRIREAARRYREYADKTLEYAYEKGRISKEQLDAIRGNNKFYANLTRINEVSPTEEPLAFINRFSKGGLTSVKGILNKAQGGTGVIQDPYISLLKTTSDIIIDTDRNEVLQRFVEPLTEKRNMGDGKPLNLSSIGRQVPLGETKNAKTIFIDGDPQRWQFDEDVYKALTGMDATFSNGIIPTLAALPGKALRWTVTHTPIFAAKNIARDTLSRLILSRSNSGLKELTHTLSDRELFDLYGGSQAGYYLTSREAYNEELSKAIQKLVKEDKSIILDPKKLERGLDSYKRTLEKSENVNRIAEFKSAFKKAKAEGLDDYNAGLYAAYQARDLMDFAVAGHIIREVNRFIPFTNAAVQGLRRSAKSIKENPAKFLSKVAIYTVAPQIAVRLIVYAMGDNEDYEQLPAYQRDLFWNFRTPFTGDKWISIPKPFDLGIISSTLDRGISYALGNKHAFEGLPKSLINILMPFDEATLLGPIKTELEIMLNKDTYRDKSIIPVWEEKKLLQDREGTQYASRLGKMVSSAIGIAGVEADPRYIDFWLRSRLSYYGGGALALSDLGRKDSRNKFGAATTGFAKDTPVSNAQVVVDVYKLAEKLGKERNSRVKYLRDQVSRFYELETYKERIAQSRRVYDIAKDIREDFEKELKSKTD